MTHELPPRVPHKIKSAPKIRQIYWCNFPQDAQLPELWKIRPVIILSKVAYLHGTVTVIPCSTQERPPSNKSFPLRTTIDGRAQWAICDYVTTVAVSRLEPSRYGIPRMPQDEFDQMLAVVLNLLPIVPIAIKNE